VNNVDESRQDHGGRASRLGTRLRALRAFSFPVSVLPVLVTTAAVRPLAEWDWGVLVASAVGVLLLHAAGNLFNDYFDFRSGVDRRVTGDEGRPGRFLVHGEMTPAEVLGEALVCLLLLVPAAVYLLVRYGPGLLWFGGAAAFALYAYTGPPFQFKYRALGELLIFLVFGPVLMLGAAYAQTGRLEWSILLFAIPIGFVTTALLICNNIRDRQEDREAEIITLVSIAGERAARFLYVTLVTASPLCLATLGVVGLAPRVLVVAPLFLLLLLEPLAGLLRGRRIPDIDVRTARFETVLLLFLVTVLVIGGARS
jgi:1,4-dihydroxy-2-naphthoate octaprenyltransferase